MLGDVEGYSVIVEVDTSLAGKPPEMDVIPASGRVITRQLPTSNGYAQFGPASGSSSELDDDFRAFPEFIPSGNDIDTYGYRSWIESGLFARIRVAPETPVTATNRHAPTYVSGPVGKIDIDRCKWVFVNGEKGTAPINVKNTDTAITYTGARQTTVNRTKEVIISSVRQTSNQPIFIDRCDYVEATGSRHITIKNAKTSVVSTANRARVRLEGKLGLVDALAHEGSKVEIEGTVEGLNWRSHYTPSLKVKGSIGSAIFCPNGGSLNLEEARFRRAVLLIGPQPPGLSLTAAPGFNPTLIADVDASVNSHGRWNRISSSTVATKSDLRTNGTRLQSGLEEKLKNARAQTPTALANRTTDGQSGGMDFSAN